MFEKFSEQSIALLSLGPDEARRLGKDYFGSEHLLLALLKQKTSVVVEYLKEMNIDLKSTRTEVERYAGRGRVKLGWGPFGWGAVIPVNEDVRVAFNNALILANDLNSRKIESEHIFAGTLQNENSVARTVLENLGVDINSLQLRVLRFLEEQYRM